MKQDMVFRAIGDPTRRGILDLLAGSDEGMSLVALAAHFRGTRQAVTKHVKILHAAGLVTMKKRGREHLCLANPSALEGIHQWVSAYEEFWDEKLQALGGFLEGERAQQGGSSVKKTGRKD